MELDLLAAFHHETLLAQLIENLPERLLMLGPVYMAQARICDRLEAAADRLPHIDERQIVGLVPLLREHLPALMRFEEAQVLPVLRQDTKSFGAICRQIIWEHEEDADEALELASLLEDTQKTGMACHCELIGFRLRAFFTSLSRHLFWENRMLTGLDVEELAMQHQGQKATTLPDTIKCLTDKA